MRLNPFLEKLQAGTSQNDCVPVVFVSIFFSIGAPVNGYISQSSKTWSKSNQRYQKPLTHFMPLDSFYTP